MIINKIRRNKMKTWIISTLIIGSIVFFAVGKANKAVQKRVNNNEYNIAIIDSNDKLTTLLDYVNTELGK
jgi:hypothetical protein